MTAGRSMAFFPFLFGPPLLVLLSFIAGSVTIWLSIPSLPTPSPDTFSDIQNTVS